MLKIIKFVFKVGFEIFRFPQEDLYCKGLKTCPNVFIVVFRSIVNSSFLGIPNNNITSYFGIYYESIDRIIVLRSVSRGAQTYKTLSVLLL